MTTIAIISDIHANLEALLSVIGTIKRLGIEEIWCLGDIVGYGPDPEECIEVIKEHANYTVMGNHDAVTAEVEEPLGFNPVAKNAILWTRKTLKEKHKIFLKSLPIKISLDKDFLLVHSSPYMPDSWHYIFDEFDARFAFKSFSEKIAFVGHSHIPTAFSIDQKDHIKIEKFPLKIDPEKRYIINVGSIGQPRDGNPQAAFSLYNKEENTIELIRVNYNIEKTAKKIINLGLPKVLANRLYKGI